MTSTSFLLSPDAIHGTNQLATYAFQSSAKLPHPNRLNLCLLAKVNVKQLREILTQNKGCMQYRQVDR
jgi:hypothetical protein